MNKDFTEYKICRFCESKKIVKVIDLGNMPLAGGFLKNKQAFKDEKKYPLKLNFCKNCFLLQTSISINPDKLFKNYFYFSSKVQTLVMHFQKTAKKLNKNLKKNSFVVEIGCNDGEFIKALQKNNFKALGIDPASNVVKPLIKNGAPIINAYFSEKLAIKIVKKYGQCDAIYSFHSLAHIPDMIDVIKGIKILLKDNGFLSFEVHYVGDLLKGLQYDMVYHEHLHYYSLLSLKELFNGFELEIYNIEKNDIRAGSITYFVQNKNFGTRKINKSVNDLEKKEQKEKLNTPIPFIKFNKEIKNTKIELLNKLTEIKTNGSRIAGYGASGRGTIIANYCNLTPDLLDFIVDDSSAKQGFYMPGTHNEILSSENLVSEKIKYTIVFAWPFIQEVKKRNKDYIKNGGRFILPLPKVRIL